MSDRDETDAPPAPRPRKSCGWLVAGFVLAVFLGTALAFIAFPPNAPGWVGPVAFFAVPALYLVVAAAAFLPRVVREMREALRNAPSPERVAAAARGEGVEAGTKPEPVTTAGADDTPTVPLVPTHPGKTLPHRLERADIPASCQFGCSILMAAFWNGIVSVFVVRLLAKWNRGGGFKWVEAAFLVPFVLVGAALVGFVVYAGYKLFVAMLVGRLDVELDAHPLAPGGKARFRVAQVGMFALSRVRVWLVCTEEASYMAGTSKSTAKEEVVRQAVSDPDQNPDGGGLPLEADFTVPPDAMHAFEAPNNAIKWTIVVSGRVLGLPFSDVYAVGVAPEQGAEAREQRSETENRSVPGVSTPGRETYL